MRTNKASGSDGIPAEVLKDVARSHLLLLLNIFNSCSVAVVFPSRRKKAKVVFIPKGLRRPDLPDLAQTSLSVVYGTEAIQKDVET